MGIGYLVFDSVAVGTRCSRLAPAVVMAVGAGADDG